MGRQQPSISLLWFALKHALQSNVPEFKIKLEDNTDIRSKVLSLTPKNRKTLGINKPTLWYVQKHIREDKRIKAYGKVMGKIK